MAKSIYTGISGTARKVKKSYIGIGNVARKLKKMYIGDSNGKARLTWSGGGVTSKLISLSIKPNMSYYFSSEQEIPDRSSLVSKSFGFTPSVRMYVQYDPKHQCFFMNPMHTTEQSTVYIMRDGADVFTAYTLSTSFRSNNGSGYWFNYDEIDGSFIFLDWTKTRTFRKIKVESNGIVESTAANNLDFNNWSDKSISKIGQVGRVNNYYCFAARYIRDAFPETPLFAIFYRSVNASPSEKWSWFGINGESCTMNANIYNPVNPVFYINDKYVIISNHPSDGSSFYFQTCSDLGQTMTIKGAVGIPRGNIVVGNRLVGFTVRGEFCYVDLTSGGYSSQNAYTVLGKSFGSNVSMFTDGIRLFATCDADMLVSSTHMAGLVYAMLENVTTWTVAIIGGFADNYRNGSSTCARPES